MATAPETPSATPPANVSKLETNVLPAASTKTAETMGVGASAALAPREHPAATQAYVSPTEAYAPPIAPTNNVGQMDAGDPAGTAQEARRAMMWVNASQAVAEEAEAAEAMPSTFATTIPTAAASTCVATSPAKAAPSMWACALHSSYATWSSQEAEEEVEAAEAETAPELVEGNRQPDVIATRRVSNMAIVAPMPVPHAGYVDSAGATLVAVDALPRPSPVFLSTTAKTLEHPPPTHTRRPWFLPRG